jgi:CheY-like chemotaxis protein
MNTFEVLVVDDDEGITDILKNRVPAGINVTIAASASEATEIIKEAFFHLAFIDMQLRTNSPDGMTVFNYLHSFRPSCKAYLLTKYPDVYCKQLFTLLNPLNCQIQGAIDKDDYATEGYFVVEGLSSAWLSNRRTVRDVETITSILAKRMRDSKVTVTAAEIDFLLSSLFGQGMDVRLNDGSSRNMGLMMSTIELKELEGGRSRSFAGAGQPVDQAGNRGIWCVVKIGPLAEIEQEYSRYCSYVRFAVALDHRVEVLGHAFGDTVGAICYSFAGKSPEAIRGLNNYFQQQADVSNVFRKMFSLDHRELYARTGKPVSLSEYFNDTYALDPRKIKDIASGLVAHCKKNCDDIGILADEKALAQLGSAFSDSAMRRPLTTCIVHGDMNANNVIVGEDGTDRVIYIDYYRTGVGPRAIDFAALEASVRMATCPSNIPDIVKDAKREERVWRNKWKRLPPAATDYSPNDETYWEHISCSLSEYARQNFPDMTLGEYAATCFLWGARLLRIHDLAMEQRVRILLWITYCAPYVLHS